MITIKEIEQRTMTPEKKASAKNDFFAYYIGRKLSYILTIPFLYTNIKPNTVSLISIIPLVIGFFLMGVAENKTELIIGWSFFFLWNLLDGVDGNIARYKKMFSKKGSVYDAMSGYVAMVFSFFGIGIIACHFPGMLSQYLNFKSELYIILGALSGVFVIFPKLIMHKATATVGKDSNSQSLTNWSKFGAVKVLLLNLTSAAGMLQVFMLVSIVFNLTDIFTLSYFFLNMLIMVVAIYSVLKE